MGDEASALGSSRQAVLAAATELFAERGYDQVTIRDIATRAALSPAMVMKCGGRKRELFLRSATITPPSLPDVPRSELGVRLSAPTRTACVASWPSATSIPWPNAWAATPTPGSARSWSSPR
ncbi:TetR/AcrR family transcriptional regulator [Plantactinospora sp. GCM10030261]|uniref:TetR/AcrR family transcriptional regulator n=1 Tax=Plantactinospora sp. GCM10030261 TaxID=3273420 RepID=UPI003624027A